MGLLVRRTELKRRLLYQKRDARRALGWCGEPSSRSWPYGMKVNFVCPETVVPHGQNGTLLFGRAAARTTT